MLFAVFFAFSVFCAAPFGSALAGVEVKGLRIGEHPQKTRIVIDLSERVEYRLLLLPDPYRIVIDLPEVTFRLDGARRLGGAIAGYRFGLFQPGTSRVVIDASKPMIVEASFLLPPRGGYGDRLVLDLRPAERTAFLAASDASIRSRTAMPSRNMTAVAAMPGAAAVAPRRLVPDSRAAGATASALAPGIAATVAATDGGAATDNRTVNRLPVIVIDPGHGGVDPGTIGRSGVYEKAIVLSVARAVKRELEATGRYRVVLTRERDIFVRLRQRFAIAQETGADLFISLHADSIDDAALRGASVYTLSETASDKEAAQLAAHTNAGDTIAGISFDDKPPEVARFLIDLAQRDTMNQSARFAQILVSEMDGRVRLLGRAHRFAGFAVLKAPDVPSVLIELGFLSNASDEKLLRSTKHHRSIAESLRVGIERYFSTVRSASR